jgi:hypothetical protein
MTDDTAVNYATLVICISCLTPALLLMLVWYLRGKNMARQAAKISQEFAKRYAVEVRKYPLTWAISIVESLLLLCKRGTIHLPLDVMNEMEDFLKEAHIAEKDTEKG